MYNNIYIRTPKKIARTVETAQPEARALGAFYRHVGYRARDFQEEFYTGSAVQ